MRRRRRIPLLGRLSPSEICGHAAFVLSGSAFLEPEILQLRVLSVFAGSATLLFTYFHPIGSPLWLPFRWNIVFVLINSAYITKILAERRRAEQLPQQALDVWRDVFQPHGMCKVEFDGLLHAGTWTTLRKGAVLQEEGKPSNSLFLIVSGGATVSRGGEFTHSLGEQQFVGEMGLSSGIHLASPVLGVAHVETSEQTTVLVWSRRVLSELMDSSDALASGIRGAITADVVRKTRRLELEASSSTNTESVQRHGEQMEELWNARYASIIGALTSEGSISEEQREQVRSYRNLHQITGEAHVRALALQGWSASEFEAGERGESAKPGSAASADTAWASDGAGLGGGSGGGASASMGGMVRRRRGGSSDGFGELRDAASKTLLGEGVREGVKALNQRVEALRTAHIGTWGSEEPPLEIWDERRQKVAAVQERLNVYFGTDALEVDGEFGPLTQQCVELFQAQCGLRVDGRVAEKTWTALRHTHRNRLDESELLGVVRSYEHDAAAVEIDVALLQRRLQAVLGADVVTADGVYGPRTRAAVQRFLRSTRGEEAQTEVLDDAAQATLRDLHLSRLEAESLAAASSSARAAGSGEEEAASVRQQQVRVMQLALRQVLPRDVGVVVDGVYAERTHAAVVLFQETYGLPVGGEIGEQLHTVMSVLRHGDDPQRKAVCLELDRRRERDRRRTEEAEQELELASAGRDAADGF